MLYFFRGSEGYLKDQEIRKEREKLEDPEFCYQEYWEWTNDILEFVSTVSFLGDRKICVLHFFPDQDAFSKANFRDDVDVYIVTAEIPDTRKSSVKEILKKCITKDFDKISEKMMMKCIEKRLSSRFGFSKVEISAAKEELKRAFHPYLIELTYDLNAVILHVDMIGYAGNLESNTIQAFALESTSLKAYKLSNMMLDQDYSCLDFAKCLLVEQGESPILVISVMLFQIRVCYKASLYEKENYLSLIGIRNFQLYSEFRRYPVGVYAKLHHLLQDAVNRIKRGEKNTVAVVLETIMNCLLIERGERAC